MRFETHTLSPLDRIVLDVLREGVFSTIGLIKDFEKRNLATKQAVYRSLKALSQREILFIHKKKIIINQLWVETEQRKIEEYRMLADMRYERLQELVASTEDKKQRFTFNNFLKADIFWSHAFLSLITSSQENSSVYFYNPHQIFFIVRPENELHWMDVMAKRSKNFVMAIGNTTQLDFDLKKVISSPDVRYSVTGDKIDKKDRFINSVGDFVLTAQFSQDVVSYMNDWFENNSFGDAVAYQKFSDFIYNKKHKVSIVIERNKEIAEKIQKRIGKHFVLR